MDWKAKLSSRKFWVAVSGLVVGVIALFHPGTDASQITGVIMALGSVVAYIVGEGMVDAAATDTAKKLSQSDEEQANSSKIQK